MWCRILSVNAEAHYYLWVFLYIIYSINLVPDAAEV